MQTFLTIVLGSIALVVVGVVAWVFNVLSWAPSIAVAVTVYVAFYRDSFGALSTALVLGSIGAMMNGGAAGIYILSLLPAVGVALLLRPGSSGGSIWQAALLAGVAALIADLVFAGLHFLFRPGVSLFPVWWRVAVPSAVVTMVLSLPLFAILRQVDEFFVRRRTRGGVMQ